MKIEIQKTGEIQPLDENGCVVNTSAKEKITAPWDGAVKDLVKVYQEKFGEALSGIYLRGSVPIGKAIEGLSDLDSIVAIKPEYTELVDLRWFDDFEKAFSVTHSYVNGVELQWVNQASLLNPNKLRGTRIQLSIYGVCVYGEDLVSVLPKLKPGRDTVIHAFTIRQQVNQAIEKIKHRESSEGVKSACTWIMKAFLRTGCELIMERERAYTRDLYPCYELFAKYYPQQAEKMYQALEYALNPIDDRQALTTFVADFGAWLVSESESQDLLHSERQVS